MRLSILMPVYNEACTLRTIVRRVLESPVDAWWWNKTLGSRLIRNWAARLVGALLPAGGRLEFGPGLPGLSWVGVARNLHG